MPLDARQRKQLAARGNRLSAGLTLGEAELSDRAVDHIRRSFARTDLLKVRINVDDRDLFALLCEDLAARVPCELVQRIGRVALLFRPLPADAGEAHRDGSSED